MSAVASVGRAAVPKRMTTEPAAYTKPEEESVNLDMEVVSAWYSTVYGKFAENGFSTSSVRSVLLRQEGERGKQTTRIIDNVL